MTNAERRILVTGDVVVEHHLFQGRRATPESKALGTELCVEWGGARRLYTLVQAAAAAAAKAAPAAPKAKNVANKAKVDPSVALRSVDFGLVLAKEPDGELVSFALGTQLGDTWQLRQALGYGTEPAGRTLKPSQAATTAHDVTVIDDAGLDLRAELNQGCWPVLERGHVIVKTSTPARPGALWDHIVDRAAVARTVTTVVINAADLRAANVRLTQGISWERTALDLLREVNESPDLRSVCRAQNLIIRFDLEGALHVVLSKGKAIDARLVFDPEHREGDRLAGSELKPNGLSTAFVAALAFHVDGDGTPGSIMAGMQRGLAAAASLSALGYGPAKGSPAFPESQLVPVLLGSEPVQPVATIPCRLDEKQAQRWSILGGTRAVGVSAGQPLYGLAQRLAEYGLSALWDVPRAELGKADVRRPQLPKAFVTVDRSEIESVRALQLLVEVYVERDKGKKPLSIGVFGPPGAGKSFAVKQLALEKFGEEPIEFNLSQFDDPRELIGALHQVRDKALTGVVPLVFWDEFDSNQYKWLQYLLAPMQDGKFQDGQLSHPIGKCIFVFAGGTAPTFGTFGRFYGADAKSREDHFKLAKGPDFQSRLAGHLDVLGPNPRLDYSRRIDGAPNDPSDVAFPLRRALLLRALLGAKANDVLQIDRGLLSALLEVDVYKHGSRSMENVAYYLKNRGSLDTFSRSDLPAPALLEHHVDMTKLLELTRRTLPMSRLIDQLAPHVHRSYLSKVNSAKFSEEFPELSPQIRGDNYAAAERIGQVLGIVGLGIVEQGTPGALSKAELTKVIERDLETLAKAEHDGWRAFKEACGWRLGPRPWSKALELLQLQHDVLIPYAKLAESEKDKDRDSVRNYLKILDLGGWAVIRKAKPSRKAKPGP